MRLNEEQKSFLDKVVEGTWSINPDTGFIDVDGNVNMILMGFTEIPVKFGDVDGYFYCLHNHLSSLEGAPQSVGGDLNCDHNKLTSLKGAPQSVGGDFDCLFNKLNSLEGGPKFVGGDFKCIGNNLISLNGAPQSVGGLFSIKLDEISKSYYHVIIPKIEEMIEIGIALQNPYEYYYPYKEAYYNAKIIDIL
jgi:hypothetical protein